MKRNYCASCFGAQARACVVVCDDGLTDLTSEIEVWVLLWFVTKKRWIWRAIRADQESTELKADVACYLMEMPA